MKTRFLGQNEPNFGCFSTMNCKYCKYCKLPALDDCLAPCGCKGSVALVHRSCLVAWLVVKQQEPLWRCELCHGDIHYTFDRRSLLPAARLVAKEAVEVLYMIVLNGGQCACTDAPCSCRGLFAWARRARTVTLWAPLFGCLLWLSGFSSLFTAELCQSVDIAELPFDLYVAMDLLGSTLPRIDEKVGPVAALALALVGLSHYWLPLPCGSRFVTTWLAAATATVAYAVYIAAIFVGRSHRHTRLRVEALSFPVEAD